MESWKITQTVDLAHGIEPIVWPRALMLTGDRAGHKWRIRVRENGENCNLDGATAHAYFVRGDNATVTCAAVVSGAWCEVVLPGDCYTVDGALTAVMRLTKGDATMTLGVLHLRVDKVLTDTILDPGHIVPDLGVLLAKIEAMQAATQAGTEAAQRANQAASAASAATVSATEAAGAAQTAAQSLDVAVNAAAQASQSAGQAQGSAQQAAQAAQAAQQAAGSVNADELMAAINGKADAQHVHGNDDLTELAAWAKEPNKPAYTPDEVGALAAGWCPYDVGDLYVTKNTRHPAERWPGTVWTRIEAGRFLAAAGDGYALGSTGGAATVSLTAAQNGRHRHEGVQTASGALLRYTNTATTIGSGGPGAFLGGEPSTVYTVYSGEGAPHENRPPYIAVNIWERTA